MRTRQDKVSVQELGLRVLTEQYKRGKGTSKHADKQAARASNGGKLVYKGSNMENKIYSDETYKFYRRAWLRYCKSMREDGFKCASGRTPRTLDEAAEYMGQYIDKMLATDGKESGTKMSAWSIRAFFSGAAKVMSLSAKDYPQLPRRHADNIRRSRGDKPSDKNVNLAKYAEFVAFARSTGLRHYKELLRVKGTDLRYKDGRPYVYVACGKGGKKRESPILCNNGMELAAVISLFTSAEGGLVFPPGSVPNNIDVHALRADYAMRVYRTNARDITQLHRRDLYICRNGKVFDRRACCMVAQALGHGYSRPSVAVIHYLAYK